MTTSLLRASHPLLRSGGFMVGCNYWASHAGTRMWADWRPDVVASDLATLAGGGVQVLRVFPLWSDFQPIHQLYTFQGGRVEFRFGEEPLPDDEAGRAGVSTEMMERFIAFADLAHRHGLGLVVGLVTGWMSGRLFMPPGLEGRNPLTDPTAIMWQLRFIRHFVQRLKDHPAVLAWDLGNECNCLGEATREQAWTWTAAIVNAIRAIDPAKPVVSGMHSLTVAPHGAWTIQDQGELTDLLTTHPYPIFTPHCDQDPVHTLRGILHATAESRLYADIGGAPCLAEEFGTLGLMTASERIAGEAVRAALFSLWAHDCHGLLWWCAHDQRHLTYAPYDWHAGERELGMLRSDGSPRPVMDELGNFRALLDRLPFPTLPERLTDAVCILSKGQDHWGVAFSSFLLGKQAGLDITFQAGDQPLRAAPLYLLPSVSDGGLSRRHWLALLDRVAAGATLYLSLDDALLTDFREVTGLEAQTRQRRTAPAAVTFTGIDGLSDLTLTSSFRLTLAAERAEALGREADGNPAFTRAAFGQGTVYFLNFPLEAMLANTPGAFHAPDAPPCWRLYAHLLRGIDTEKVIRKTLPDVGVTEHPLDANSRLAVLINYTPHSQALRFPLRAGWAIADTLYGPPVSGVEITGVLPAHDALICRLTR